MFSGRSGKIFELCSSGNGGLEFQLTVKGLHNAIMDHPRISYDVKNMWCDKFSVLVICHLHFIISCFATCFFMITKGVPFAYRCKGSPNSMLREVNARSTTHSCTRVCSRRIGQLWTFWIISVVIGS